VTDKSLAINQALGVERLGEIMWKSGYWQDTRSQAQAIVKILAGAELEFGPITSMNGINIIEGKTSLSANLVGAAIQRSGRYRYRVTEHDAKHCVIDFFEIVGGVREKLGTSSFDMEDAKAAGLLNKAGGNWTKYPRNMVFSRALTNGARWYTPDVFGGPVYTPDELGAEINEAGDVVDLEPRYVPIDERDVDDAPRPRDRRGLLLERYGALLTQARHAGVVQDAAPWVLRSDTSEAEIERVGKELKQRIEESRNAQSVSASERSEPAAELTTSPSD
jgi:hypothetical protein